LTLLAAVVLLASLLFALPAHSASPAGKVKELNFVFLHGLGANASAMQRLQDAVLERVTAYARAYQQDHPGITLRVDSLNRSYPNQTDIGTWSKNVAADIDRHFPGKDNLIFIGHSMGGKVALYTVANDVGKMAGRTAMVATINSPVRSLQGYYYVNGKAATNYWELNWLVSNLSAINSLVSYDSAQDGLWVGRNRHWLALVSAESAPLSSQFDASGVDPLPRDMDDVIVPISAQYAEGADVVYYGEYGHGDFTDSDPLSGALADQVLNYLFGGNVQCSTLARAGTFGHQADIFPGADHWEDLVGGLLAGSGTLVHENDSFWWKEWEDVLGDNLTGSMRSNFEPRQAGPPLAFSGVIGSGWANPANVEDGRLRLKTRAAPRSTVQAPWSIYQLGLLPAGIARDHYEVEIYSGNPLADITRVTWETADPRDLRLRIWSQAESPFRQFSARWRVYFKENRQRDVVGELKTLDS
jgi:pimeloyl-ACP methyl ester carboxylesterase